MGEIEHLPDLAADINDEHRNCERAVNAALDHALKASPGWHNRSPGKDGAVPQEGQ